MVWAWLLVVGRPRCTCAGIGEECCAVSGQRVIALVFGDAAFGADFEAQLAPASAVVDESVVARRVAAVWAALRLGGQLVAAVVGAGQPSGPGYIRVLRGVRFASIPFPPPPPPPPPPHSIPFHSIPFHSIPFRSVRSIQRSGTHVKSDQTAWLMRYVVDLLGRRRRFALVTPGASMVVTPGWCA